MTNQSPETPIVPTLDIDPSKPLIDQIDTITKYWKENLLTGKPEIESGKSFPLPEDAPNIIIDGVTRRIEQEEFRDTSQIESPLVGLIPGESPQYPGHIESTKSMGDLIVKESDCLYFRVFFVKEPYIVTLKDGTQVKATTVEFSGPTTQSKNPETMLPALKVSGSYTKHGLQYNITWSLPSPETGSSEK